MLAAARPNALLRTARRVQPNGMSAAEAGRSPPLEIVSARGAQVFDAAGRAYLDFCNDGGAVLLGHGDADVAGRKPRVTDVDEAERHLCACLPYADDVRLAASESAAMLAALRVARAETGRERVLAQLGRPVPGARAAFRLEDLSSLAVLLESFADEVAAVVVEPVGPTPASPAALARLKALVHAHGALLIYDETRAGLRAAESGGFGLTGVAPDLSVFGRGLGNGADVAAVVCARPMPLRLAPTPAEPAAASAAVATLDKITRAGVPAALRVRGAELQAEVEALVIAAGAAEMIWMGGDPTWSVLGFTRSALRSALVRGCRERGVHIDGGHAMSLAHGDQAVETLLAVYADVLPRLVERQAESCAA